MKISYFIFIILLLAAQTSAHAQKKLNKNDLNVLVKNLKGFYTNTNQVKADSNYPLASLSILPIWPNYLNSQWTYIKLLTKSNKFDSCLNYLFQIFKANDSLIIFQPYILQIHLSSKNFNQSYFEKMSKNQLIKKIGCAIFFRRIKNSFYYGQTNSSDCANNIEKGSFESFYIGINENEISWWNIGFDNKGSQVWGNDLGKYIFNKVNN